MAASNEPMSVQPKYDQSARRIDVKMIQNVLLIWLDVTIDESNTDCQNTITHLRKVINTINTFADADQCVDFLEEVEDEKICMLISGSLGEHIVPCIHDIFQVDSIFIFCGNKQYHEQWAKDWSKVKGVFTDIQSICDALKQSVTNCEQNAIGFSVVAAGADSSNMNLDRLDPMFMYTQIIKEILLVIKFEQKHILDFTKFCRELFETDNTYWLNKVQIFEHDYHSKTPIYWYTWESFLYPMLNRALRLSDMEVIVKMGFFIGDLHRQIQHLHQQQFSGANANKQFVVFRGQGMSKDEFEKVSKTKGGLIAFNNFLSTSETESVSVRFAERALLNSDLVGVLFEMKVDSKQSTTPFAFVAGVGAYDNKEKEILFAMHTVFRIRDIQPMDGNARLFRVKLELTSDKDQDLQVLTKLIREETCLGTTGWYRLALVLTGLGKPKQAEEIYQILLEQESDESQMAPIYHQLGICKADQGEYDEAIRLYQKAIVIYEKYLPNSLSLANSYNNIGGVYSNMDKNARALSSFEKALAIKQQLLSPNHHHLAGSYNNIGGVYLSMGEYAKALSSFEKALAIQRQSLPLNHPHSASPYGNIGNVYFKMGENVKALSSHEKALAIRQQSLPPSHPDLASTYHSIGLVYENMKSYSKAYSFIEKAVKIAEQSLPTNHRNLKKWKSHLDRVKNKL